MGTGHGSVGRAGFDGSQLARVDELFEAVVAAGQAPGVAYGVVDHGRLVHAGGAGVLHADRPGRPDERSIFRIASLTKSFTAAAVLRLRDSGRLGLDDPVSGYVPELAGVRLPTADSPQITVRHLLTMSGGLPTDDAWADRQESMTPEVFGELLGRGIGFVSAPGVGFEYANLGFALLGRVVSRVAGQDYRDEVRQQLLGPLRLVDTAFAEVEVDAGRLAWGHRHTSQGWLPLPFDRPGVFSAIGGVFSTVADLARWVGGLSDAFPPRDVGDTEDGHPLGRASRREMQQVHRLLPLAGGDPSGAAAAGVVGYGLGLFVEVHPVLGTVTGHPGGYPGYGAQMSWSTAHGVGVIALANGRYAPVTPPARRALELLLEGRGHPVPAPWPETVQAARDVDRLLRGWDDTLADRIFADNVDLDLPRPERRDEFAQAAAMAGLDGGRGSAENATAGPRSGVTEASFAAGLRHPTPASASWEVAGARGRVHVQIALTPQRPPLVQSVVLRSETPPDLRL